MTASGCVKSIATSAASTPRPVVAHVDGGHQLQPIGGFDRAADLGTHPPTRPEDGDLHEGPFMLNPS